MEKKIDRACKVFMIVAELSAIVLTMLMMYSTATGRIEFDWCIITFIAIFVLIAVLLHSTQRSIKWD